MIKNIISLVLLITTAFLSLKHGWDTLRYRDNPDSLKMISDLDINESLIPFLGVFTIVIGILLLIPYTFFLGNILNAISILLIMAFSLKAGNYKIALIEIPFLIVPLVLIWLKYPFKN